MSRLKATFPLHKTEFERDFEAINENVLEIGRLYETLDKKCQDWKKRFKQHNLDFYTLTYLNDTVKEPITPLYVDPYWYEDFAETDETNDYYEPFPINLKKPSEDHKCHFMGHHRKCPSPKKRNEQEN